MRLSLRIGNQSAAIDRLTKFVAKFSRLHGLPEDEGARLLVIFDELLTNVATYGFEGVISEGYVEVALSLEGNHLIVEFVDDGRPFDPLATPQPDMDLPIAERPIGGIGIAIVRALVDEIRYTRDGNHNRLVLGRTISGAAGGAADEAARQG